MLKSQKPHIGIFGRRNVGKSSIINAITGQEIAIVSPVPGTTTDTVTKTMEITGVGPVVITDTAGIDDEGELGRKRVARTERTLDLIDLGVIVISHNQFGEFESKVAAELGRRGTPFFVLHNKSDLAPLTDSTRDHLTKNFDAAALDFSAIHPTNYEELIAIIQKTMPESSYRRQSILGDLVTKGDIVLMVAPVDAETPEGRLILPQVQAIRDCLDNDCTAIVTKDPDVRILLENMRTPPRIVVTDSQAFEKVSASVPDHIPMTSFSILYARLKGDFEKFREGTPAISKLCDNDRVLILESCSHHVIGDDIGRVKLPRWLTQFTGKKLDFETVAGTDLPGKEIGDYKLVIQCGGCMLTRKQVNMRIRPAIERGVPVTNYGMAIAWCFGIYNRAMEPFKE